MQRIRALCLTIDADTGILYSCYSCIPVSRSPVSPLAVSPPAYESGTQILGLCFQGTTIMVTMMNQILCLRRVEEEADDVTMLRSDVMSALRPESEVIDESKS